MTLTTIFFTISFDKKKFTILRNIQVFVHSLYFLLDILVESLLHCINNATVRDFCIKGPNFDVKSHSPSHSEPFTNTEC